MRVRLDFFFLSVCTSASRDLVFDRHRRRSASPFRRHPGARVSFFFFFSWTLYAVVPGWPGRVRWCP
ncbi:hypothetical protein psal_cds_483 [Pandoravirus salinus]|uniref:Uncharacterized protein n=1 Tax=Pandoravirus salinus TaxID=1349410 RepID=S4VV60_9VIRU|nr:hypothetical protein psal_cds_483 [Pandoravirus salinus]AGO84263.1 hypothetical protein psal_cds_483 [Pandoravirus salinus]